MSDIVKLTKPCGFFVGKPGPRAVCGRDTCDFTFPQHVGQPTETHEQRPIAMPVGPHDAITAMESDLSLF